jgi:DNA-binding response OmpR family regulator
MKHSILIIDDDPLILKTLEGRFSIGAVKVRTVSTPEEAKEALENHPIELVLLDLLLTKDDGALDILDFMKTRPNLENIPVLVLTNLDMPDLKQIMLSQGIREYLVKGAITIDELHAKVMSYLEAAPTS